MWAVPSLYFTLAGEGGVFPWLCFVLFVLPLLFPIQPAAFSVLTAIERRAAPAVAGPLAAVCKPSPRTQGCPLPAALVAAVHAPPPPPCSRHGLPPRTRFALPLSGNHVQGWGSEGAVQGHCERWRSSGRVARSGFDGYKCGWQKMEV